MDNSKTVKIEGGVPLIGNVKIGGSRALAVKLIYAAVLSGETCVLVNVPKSRYILDDLDIIQTLGVTVAWLGPNKLSINSQDINDFHISGDLAAKTATAAFLVPALVHKFGKAVLPKGPRGRQYGKIWESFGMEVKEDFDNYYVEAVKLRSGEVVLPYKSRVLTDIAIVSALFVLGESVILNASNDVETDDLIDFCNKIGGDVQRLENGGISVRGSGVFKGIEYTLPFDREEAAFFIVASLLTNGNTTILGVDRTRILPLVNWLSKAGANYEFTANDMRVWHNTGVQFLKTEVTVLPHPGFITDFSPFAVFLDCFASGESIVLESALSTHLDYIKDLSALGADIEVTKDPEGAEIKVRGPIKLKSGKLRVTSLKHALLFLLVGLSVEGINELEGFELVEDGFEDILDRLKSLNSLIVNDL